MDGWEQLVKRNPYAFQYSDENFEYLQEHTRSRSPVLNGDWLVYASSVSPLYEEILELPDTVAEFLDQFGGGLDLDENVRKLNATRAGFYQSGVSLHNRVIERHATHDGYCWVRHDFISSTGNKNIFAHPLDDDALFLGADGVDFFEEDGFQEDGGEMFCSLPNGLQVYYLANAAGNFLSEGPIQVVSDPNNEEEGYLVQNGRSCMNCHYNGTIPKEDEVAEFIRDTDYFSFTEDQLHAIEELYDAEETSASIAEDQEFFLTAVDQTEVPRVYETEPIFALSRAFAEPLTEARVMAELGLNPDEKDLEDVLDEADPALVASINQIFGAAATVDREAFLPLVQELLCVANNQDPATCPDLGDDCSSPDFDLDGDGALDVFGLPCPADFTCLDDEATHGEDAGACVP